MLTDEMTNASVCYLETIGRRTGNPHEIEIWFASEDGATLYLLSGGGDRADWVRNLRSHPACRVRFGREWFEGVASEIEGAPDELRGRQIVAAKYYGWRDGPLPNQWARESLPVRIDLTARPAAS